MFKNIKFDFDRRDCITVVGIALMCYGLYEFYQPAAYILAGYSLFKVGTTGTAGSGE